MIYYRILGRGTSLEKESFRILKELNSLNLRIGPLEKAIKDELSRIKKIEVTRSKRSQEKEQQIDHLANLKIELENTEHRIDKLSKGLKKMKLDEGQLFTENEISAYRKQLAVMQEELSQHEDRGLELLEQIEDTQIEINDANNFLEGSLESICEIEDDIKKENEETYKEIQIIRQRVEILLKQLPEKVTIKFNKLLGTKKYPLSEISLNNSCQICGYLIPKALITSLETTMKFHTCPGCERILIPQGSKYL